MDFKVHYYCWPSLPKVSKQTLKIMKLIAIILFAACLQVSARGYSQITLSETNTPLQKVFQEIQQQSGYDFVSTYETLKKAGNVTVKVQNVSLQKALEECLKGKPLTYVIIGKTVVIKLKEKHYHNESNDSIALEPLPPPPIEIHGRVTNQQGEPLQNVSVLVAGTRIGTTTNSDGRFTLTAPDDKNLILEISSVGYVTKKVSVGKQSEVNVVLETDVAGLSDVVVVGYGTQKKKDITGSVVVVDMNNVRSIPTGTASQAIQGQAAGVNVIASGAPGGRTDIFIRGITSFGNSEPLVIVDGIQGSLDDLNIDDIASIQILKDAGAASIYGVRGSNGVIVVTTKKGKPGEPIITYDSYYGIKMPKKGNVFNLLNPTDYAAFLRKINPGTILFANGIPDFTYTGPGISGTAMAGDPAVDPAKYNFDAANPENDYLIQRMNKSGTDWFHEIFKNAPVQSHTITTSGGTDKSNFLFSLGYLNQQGTLIESYLKRYSARVNSQFKIKKNIRIGENAYYYYKQNPGFNNQSDGNEVSLAYRIMTMIPVHDIEGNYGGTWLGPELGDVGNVVAIRERSRSEKNNFWDMSGNVYAEIDFLRHLTFRTVFGGSVDNQYNYNFNFNQYDDKEQHNSLNGFNENALYNSSYTWTNTVNYQQAFGKNNIKILAGSEAIRNYGRGVGGSAEGYFSTDEDYLILGNGTTNIQNYSNAYVNTLFSLFGRLDYSYNDKYLLGATIRRDGSSKFGSDKRYGIFPSFSLGWKISDEGFMKNVTFVNNLKLRGSYGILGSQSNVNPDNPFTLFSSGFGTSYYDINGTGNTRQGFYQSSIGNPNTGWEKDIITNIGLDGSFLNNKLGISVEWYEKSINGLLFPLPLPAITGGADAPTINIGDIQNKGWDISATYRETITKDFQFNISANITAYRNKVVKIPDPGYFDVANSRIGNLVRNEQGHAVGSFFGYQVIGLFKDDGDVSKSPSQTDAAPGRFKYKDVDGDKKITPNDRTFFGNPNPDFTYGVNLGIGYKQFDLSGIFYGSYGNDVINFVRYFTDFYGSAEGRAKSNLLKNAWTPQNQNTTIPVVEYANTFSTNGTFNSYLKENGSFFKLRSLILSYTVNPGFLQRISINKFKIYVQATNLFTITKYTGIDPELNGSLGGDRASSSFGIDYGNYPNNEKSFLFGVNLTF